MSVLVVVDMQPAYKPALYPPVQEAVAREIVRARRLDNPIIFLEYRVPGSTIISLKQLAAGHDKVETRTKFTWSGANEVIDICTDRGWDLSETDWTGVERECCVADSVNEFHTLRPESIANVIDEAVNGYVLGWAAFARHRNIRFVSQRDRIYV